MQESSFSLSGVQMTRNYVSAIIEGSGIYSYDTYSGQKQQIGVTNECYTQLQNTAREATDKAEEYYNKLVEVGVIVPPKTPEQTIAELSCNVPKRPPYFAQGYVACGTPIPAGCCN